MTSLPKVAAILVAAVCVFPATAPAQQLLQDAKLGFKLKAPNDFNKVPLQNDEEWIVARWISARSYYAQLKDGFTTDEKIELSVIAFPVSKTKTGGDNTNGGAVDLSKSSVFILKNPYKDYQAYLKGTFHEGGYYVAKDDKAEVEGIQVQTLDIKVEKLVTAPKKVLTWIFKCDDAEFAVQFELLESAYPKLKGEIEACMRSFRRIPKDANAAGGSGAGTRPVVENTGDLTPAQRAARRREQETQAQEKYTKGLTEGWAAKKYGRVFIMSHTSDEKYAVATAANANAVLDFLDSNFGFLGPGEYVRSPVIRICKDFDEMRLYDKGGGSGVGVAITSGDSLPRFIWDREITTYRDTYSAGAQWGDRALEEVFTHWISEHDEHALDRMPTWLVWGLERCFRMSKAKGGKLEFFNDSDERVAISQAVHAGKLTKFSDLVKLESTALGSNRGRDYECAAATRFLLTGPKKAKDALQAYLVAVAKIARRDEEELRKSQKSSGDPKPKTIEEEDARFKDQNSKRAGAEKSNLEEVFKAAFGTWTDADWKSFESVYEKSLN
jgi:hypothetical protein